MKELSIEEKNLRIMKREFNMSYKQDIIDGKVKVVTKDNRPVEILKWNRIDDEGRHIIALIHHSDECEDVYHFYEDGRCDDMYGNDAYNLYVITDEPESEDERIRKELIDYFGASHATDTFRGIPWDRVVAWLEKQGEHAKFRDSIQVGDKVTRNQDGVLVNLSQLKRVAKKDEKQGEQKPADKVEPKFKVGDWIITDKKHIWLVDEDYSTTGYLYRLVAINGKVEVAECEVVDEHARLWTIQDAKAGDVLTESKRDVILMFREIGNTEWVDVIDYYCYYDCHRKDFVIQEGVEHWGNTEDSQLKPATKEQRDQLEKAMADAGYTFDFEKKELKKIVNEEQIKKNLQDNSFRRMFEQKPADESSAFKNKLLELFQKFRYIKKGVPTNGDIIDYVDAHIQELIDTVQNNPWSEEDKKMSRFIGNAITATDASMYLESKGIQIIDAHVWLYELKDRVQSRSKQEWNKEDEYNHNIILYLLNNECVGVADKRIAIEWFKALKERYTWKPSDEQIEALDFAAGCIVPAEFCFKRKVLKELLEQLKKLKGE